MKLKTAAEIREAFSDSPKLLDSWLVSGYSAWYRRKFEKKPKDSAELAANRSLKNLSPQEWAALKRKVRGDLLK